MGRLMLGSTRTIQELGSPSCPELAPNQEGRGLLDLGCPKGQTPALWRRHFKRPGHAGRRHCHARI